MPEFRFTVREIDDIIIYLNSIQAKQSVQLLDHPPSAAAQAVSKAD